MKITKAINKLFKRKESLESSVNEIIMEHESDGEQVTSREKDLINNALVYRNFLVEDLMVPRSDIIAIDSNLTFNNIKSIFIGCKHSRLPIYISSMDNIVGFLHVKDMIKYWSDQVIDLSRVAKPLIFISSKMKAIDLLAKMRKTGMHLAIAVDEYGGVDGLLTIQDLIESIVGDIEEEYKAFDQENDYVKLSNGLINANARMTIENIEKLFDIKLSDKHNCATLAGIILSVLGRMPEKNEIINHESGLILKVVSINPRQILRVEIESQRQENE